MGEWKLQCVCVCVSLNIGLVEMLAAGVFGQWRSGGVTAVLCRHAVLLLLLLSIYTDSCLSSVIGAKSESQKLSISK